MNILKTLLKLVLGLALILVLVVAGLLLTLRANPPSSTFDLQPMAARAPDPRPVLLVGATRGTGYEVAKLLRERGDAVTAVVRPGSDRSLLEPLGVALVEGDAMEPATLQAAMASGDYRAVVSTIGCLRCEPPPDFIGNRNIIDAAKGAGIARMILITSIGVGDSHDAAHVASRIFLRRILPLKGQAEEHLRASGLDYTIIRPGGLRPRPPTGRGYLSEDRAAFGFISRGDLARLIVASLDDDRTIGRTFAAADPEVDRPWGD